MSKLSKYSRRAKDQFRRELEEYQEDAIDRECSQLELWENEAIRCDLEELRNIQDDQDWLDGYDLDDDWDYEEEDKLLDLLNYRGEEDRYDFDDPWWDEEDNNPQFFVDEVGTYYKDDQDRTFLCCEVNGFVRYINIHTGRAERVNLFCLEKVA